LKLDPALGEQATQGAGHLPEVHDARFGDMERREPGRVRLLFPQGFGPQSMEGDSVGSTSPFKFIQAG
jgi:hypothetical protein